MVPLDLVICRGFLHVPATNVSATIDVHDKTNFMPTIACLIFLLITNPSFVTLKSGEDAVLAIQAVFASPNLVVSWMNKTMTVLNGFNKSD
jgi:hypothetical protein